VLHAITVKLTEQANYVVWRDSVPKDKGGRGRRKTVFSPENGLLPNKNKGGRGRRRKTVFSPEIGLLPSADPGDVER
jgi:hypothetical protein